MCQKEGYRVDGGGRRKEKMKGFKKEMAVWQFCMNRTLVQSNLVIDLVRYINESNHIVRRNKKTVQETDSTRAKICSCENTI